MEFNLNRLKLLLAKDFMELILKTTGIVALIFFVVTTFNLVISFFANGDRHSYDIFSSWLGIMFVSCSIIGAVTWEEIKKRPSRIEYLALPATVGEKTISKIISVAIVFPILMIGVYFIVYGYATLGSLLIGDRLHLNTEMDGNGVKLFAIGSIITSFFAYGSIKYNTTSYPKIIVFGLFGFALFLLISFIIAFVLFPELRAAIFGNLQEGENVETTGDPGDWWLIKFLKNAYYLVPLIFWGLCYFTLKEKEA